MKKLATVAIAAGLALAATGATIASADAHGYRHYGAYGPAVGAGIGAGIEIDFHLRAGIFAGVGAFDGPGYGWTRRGATWHRHVKWCSARYRSYNAATDTFTGYDGRQHLCEDRY